MARIVVIGYFLVFKAFDQSYRPTSWVIARKNFKEIWNRPWLFRLIPISFTNSCSFAARLGLLYKVSLLTSTVGFCTNLSCAVSFFLGLYLLGMRHGIRTHHTVILIHFCMFAFTLGPSGEAYSLDNFFGLPTMYTGHTVLSASITTWSIQLIRISVCFFFLCTGVAKLRNSGRTFFRRGELADLLRIHDFPYTYVAPTFSASRVMRRFRVVELSGAIAVVAFELFFPIVLFVPRSELILIPMALFFLLSMRLFVGARFMMPGIVTAAVWLPSHLLALS